MEPSIALVSGATSGLGYAGARLLAIKGYRQVIVPGRSLARVQETAAPARGWDQETGFHAAGAGHAGQRSVRAREVVKRG